LATISNSYYAFTSLFPFAFGPFSRLLAAVKTAALGGTREELEGAHQSRRQRQRRGRRRLRPLLVVSPNGWGCTPLYLLPTPPIRREGEAVKKEEEKMLTTAKLLALTRALLLLLPRSPLARWGDSQHTSLGREEKTESVSYKRERRRRREDLGIAGPLGAKRKRRPELIECVQSRRRRRRRKLGGLFHIVSPAQMGLWTKIAAAFLISPPSLLSLPVLSFLLSPPGRIGQGHRLPRPTSHPRLFSLKPHSGGLCLYMLVCAYKQECLSRGVRKE
jgi:hypothetical protein